MNRKNVNCIQLHELLFFRLFGNNILSVCIHNRRAANSCGRKHLIRVWKVIEMCLRFGTAKYLF